MRRRVVTVVGAMAAVGVVVAAVVAVRSRTVCGAEPSPAPETPAPQGGFVIDGVAKSVGDVIEETDLFVRAHLVEVGTPFWNSPDGEDWTAEHDEHPRRFVVGPFVLVPITLEIDEVLFERDSAPKVEVGDRCEIVVFGTGLQIGDESIFFLDWTKLFLSEGSRQIWHVDDQGMWSIEGDFARPSVDHQGRSVGRAVRRGLVEGRISSYRRYGSVSFAELANVIREEAASPGVDVAGFDQWGS